jgi:hypothetical protein
MHLLFRGFLKRLINLIIQPLFLTKPGKLAYEEDEEQIGDLRIAK